MRIAFLVAPEGVEQIELTDPWQAVGDAGGEPVLVSTEPGRIQAFHHLDKADTFPVQHVVGDVRADMFDGLVLPGGVANPDQLRTDPQAVDFAKEFFALGLPVAAICHAPWTLVEADVLHGRTLTSWPSLRTDIRNAGGEWVDEQVKICDGGPNTLITSRKPDDLKAFCEAAVGEFTKVTKQATR
ncbi:type 1 glutamine amidotransferase domain-containing protein [Streptomyces formicae]|nr:type 1 glutamine amidotransferase domain-containing protein [Streptomyces formicae]